jgi:hypothetical protein
MRKFIALSIITLLMVSCKAKQAAVQSGIEKTISGSKSGNEIIEGHYKNHADFKTIYIKGSARYKDSKQSQNVSADIKIKKDEIILVSVKFLGITMAKAILTPQRVSYYEKIGGKYFDGNYAVLSRWLGTELDFNKVQNMLLGEAMDDLTKGTYQADVAGGKYKLSIKAKGGITKEFLFEGAKYLLMKQVIAQGGQEPRSVDIDYPAHKEYAKATLPAQVKIEAVQKDKVNIDIEYNTITFDENLSFPYDVPEGFEQIFIDKP